MHSVQSHSLDKHTHKHEEFQQQTRKTEECLCELVPSHGTFWALFIWQNCWKSNGTCPLPGNITENLGKPLDLVLKVEIPKISNISCSWVWRISRSQFPTGLNSSFLFHKWYFSNSAYLTWSRDKIDTFLTGSGYTENSNRYFQLNGKRLDIPLSLPFVTVSYYFLCLCFMLVLVLVLISRVCKSLTLSYTGFFRLVLHGGRGGGAQSARGLFLLNG